MTEDPKETPSQQPAEPPKSPPRDDIGFLASRFIQEIDSLADTLPITMRTIGKSFEEVTKELKQFAVEFGKNRDEAAGTVEIVSDDLQRFRTLGRRVGRVHAANVLIPRSFFVTLVSQYDAFLGRLIEALLLIRPEVLNASERTISFAELLNFGSIEAARDHTVEREVESVLRKSHTEQFDWLESKFNIKLREGLTAWPRFVELTERRNLFVHTDGQVSSQYLRTCTSHKVDCRSLKRGEILSIDPSYYSEAYETVFEVGVKLAHVFWRKLKPDELEEADAHFGTVTYNLLTEEKWNLAKALLDFGTDVLKKHASSERRLILVVNRVQAYKWSGDASQAAAILGAEDFSALDEKFKMAEAVLRDDFKRAAELVRRIGPSGYFRLSFYREWPLFREARRQAAFQVAVSDVFGEPLNRATIQPSE